MYLIHRYDELGLPSRSRSKSSAVSGAACRRQMTATHHTQPRMVQTLRPAIAVLPPSLPPSHWGRAAAAPWPAAPPPPSSAPPPSSCHATDTDTDGPRRERRSATLPDTSPCRPLTAPSPPQRLTWSSSSSSCPSRPRRHHRSRRLRRSRRRPGPAAACWLPRCRGRSRPTRNQAWGCCWP